MSFTSGIPASGQTLGSSRTQVQNNFTALYNAISANHVDPNSTDPGTHTHADFKAQGSDPATPNDFISLYSKAAAGITDLYLRRESSGAILQMTKGSVIASQTGQTFLPGGILLKWGTKPSGATGSTFNLTYTGLGLTAMPNATWGILVLGDSNNRSYYPSNITSSSFTINASSALGSGDVFFFLAIGN